DVDDLFSVREEQITGDLAAAVFVLRHGDDAPMPLANLDELPDGIRRIGTKGWEIKRFKGLGEMNPDELWKTTMDPSNRVLRQVIVAEVGGDAEQIEIDAVEADRMFSILMGENVELRRNFIELNAIHVKNLDI
ncbi:MAG: DNA gyrase subunit B, partial [Phycisphaerae bacterium]